MPVLSSKNNESEDDRKKRIRASRKVNGESKWDVVFGDISKTVNGLTKDKLVVVRTGSGAKASYDVKSKAKYFASANGLAVWKHCLDKARKELNVTGFVPVRKPSSGSKTPEQALGEKLYKRATEIQATTEKDHALVKKLQDKAHAELAAKVVPASEYAKVKAAIRH